MSRTEKHLPNKKKVALMALIALLVIFLGTYFTIQMANAKTVKEQLELGNRYYDEQKYEEAIIAYEKVLEIDEKNVEARIGLAKSYEALKKVVKARNVLIAGISMIPKEPSIYIELADLYLSENNILEAINTLDRGHSNSKDQKIKAKLSSIEDSMSLVSDRKEVQINHQANLKVIYERTVTEKSPKETQNKDSIEDKATDENVQNQEGTSDANKDQSETKDPNETEVQAEDSNSDSSENPEANTSEETSTEEEKSEIKPATQAIEVEAEWKLDPGEAGDLNADKGKVNVFTAKKEGTEVVTAKVGSIEKSLSLNTKEQVMENFEIVASVNKTIVGEEIQLKAIGKDFNGKEMEISPEWAVAEGMGSLSANKGATNTFTSSEPGISTIVAIIGDHEFTMNLAVEEEQFELEKNISGNGSIVANPKGSKFKNGESVTLKAVPAKGWEFVSWNGASSSESAQTTIIMNGNKKVTAVFKQKPTFYALHVDKTGEGTVIVSPQSSQYVEGTSVTVTAKAADGWKFDHWEGQAQGKNSSINVVMNNEKSIRAVFIKNEQPAPQQVIRPIEQEQPAPQPAPQPTPQAEKKTYTLTTNVNGEGTIQKSPSKTNYEEGSTVALTATPKEGWIFQKWAGDVTSTNANISVTMNGPKTVEAVFVQAQVGHVTGVIKDSDSGGTVSDATITLRKGENVQSGASTASGKTNANGQYQFNNLATGTYTMEISKELYVTDYQVINIESNQTLSKNVTIVPQQINDFKVVLEWGDQPSDLDSHLKGPAADGNGRFHVYYSRKQYIENGVTYAQLDVDARNGNGPETITSFKQIDGIYRYYVQNYSGEVPLAGSQATVKLYKNDALIKTFTVPSSGTGGYWHVFELNNGQLSSINAISDDVMN